MRIVCFSINPLYPDVVTGGASVHLKALAHFLAEEGHFVEVLCPRLQGLENFSWPERAHVLPLLEFRLPFPAPYELTAYELAFNSLLMNDQLKSADVFYIHDAQWLVPTPASSSIPTVVGIHDVMFPETMLGSFLLHGDIFITVSSYARNYFISTAGLINQSIRENIHVVPHGFCWKTFCHTEPSTELFQTLGIVPQGSGSVKYLLHPHRPDRTKGLEQSLRVIARLVNVYERRDICLLVPRWIEEMESEVDREFYQSMTQLIQELEIQEYVHFHQWLPHRLMPEYYSLGAVTLSLGSFVESFGKSVYESLGCGTPCVYAKVSWHREALQGYLQGVEFGDECAAAELVDQYLRGERGIPEDLRFKLQNDHDSRVQLSKYAALILDAKKKAPCDSTNEEPFRSSDYSLAPWCYHSSRGIYHDQRVEYLEAPVLTSLLERSEKKVSPSEAQEAGISETELKELVRKGYLIYNFST